MMNLALFLFVGGILHFGILLASAAAPQVLDWRNALQKLDRLSQQVIWVHGAFIVLTIVGFGALSICFPSELASHTILARAICGFIALFWAARLAVQFFVFDAKPYLTRPMLRLGYHGLTLVFIYHAVVYGAAAL
jgi:hypothetical protein